MINARDGASHASKNLVSSHDSVRDLAQIKRECLRVLERHPRSLALLQLPIRLPLNLYPCGDLGYLAVPELL
jgi:hypothetical protein